MERTLASGTPRVAEAQYPPSSSAFPQLIAPMGAPDGARAAHRVFIGARGPRAVDEDVFAMEPARLAWLEATGRAWPVGEHLGRAVCHVDLNPQVTGLTRGGPRAQLATLLLARAFEVGASLSDESFDSGAGSIWAVGHVDDESRGLVAEPFGLEACFQRFLEHCLVAASDKRHVFIAPEAARDLLSDLLAQAEVEHPFEERALRGEVSSRSLLGEVRDARVCVAWIPEGPEALRTALDGFGFAWAARHERHVPAHISYAPGSKLSGRYEIQRELGAGGFAVVYAASDLHVERDVAVKVIDLSRAGRGPERVAFVRRFEREARLAASVKHPCIVEVYDYGVSENEVPYMVMEMLDGHDLEVHLTRNGPMSAIELLPRFIDALEGLGYAHEAGIVHKDLKPSNLFMKFPGSRREQICILDFGVARVHTSASAKLTQTDNVLGTPRYMAPEYSTSQTVTPALDVYQMGLILVECLSGRSVVDHPEPMAAMFQHVRGELPIPQPLLNSDLGPILERALSVEHTERYANGFELADALRAINPASIPPVGPRTPVVSLASLDSEAIVRDSPDTSPHGMAMAPTIEAASDELRAVRTGPPRFRGSPDRPISHELDTLIEPRQERDLAPADTEKLGKLHEDDEPIVAYGSSTGWIAVVVSMGLLLVVAVGALVMMTREPARKPPLIDPKVDVVTAYDKELAKLRERVAPLEDRMRAGDVEFVISEIDDIQKLDVKLTPDEVTKVRALYQRAKTEKKNIEHLEKAEAQLERKLYRRALLLFERIPADSELLASPRARKLRQELLVNLRTQINTHVLAGEDEKAFEILRDVLRLDPDQPDLKVQYDELRKRLR